MYRVIQRDEYHMYLFSAFVMTRIAVSSPVGKQRCLAVYVTVFGLFIVDFYWFEDELTWRSIGILPSAPRKYFGTSKPSCNIELFV